MPLTGQPRTTSFLTSRRTDKENLEKLEALTETTNANIDVIDIYPLASQGHSTFTAAALEQDAEFQQLLSFNAVTTRLIKCRFTNGFELTVKREIKDEIQLVGTKDTIEVSPYHQNLPVIAISEFLAKARECFGTLDSTSIADLVSAEARQFYEARDRDIGRLERLQETFFKTLVKHSKEAADQQKELAKKLNAEHEERQSELDQDHQERLKKLEEERQRIILQQSALDERANRHARRDQFKEFIKTLKNHFSKFELTEGTKSRRWPVYVATIVFLTMFASGFSWSFYANLKSDKVIWVAVVTQIGCSIAFIGTATFLIRWSQLWFQRHADEEFRLKRMELDMVRAEWLAELAMEWDSLVKDSKGIPADLVEKLSRGLFLTEEQTTLDIHPTETFMSSFLGKSGNVNMEMAPVKVSVSRDAK